MEMNKSELHGNVVMSIQAHVPNMIWLKRAILFTMHIINRWSSLGPIMAPVILVDLRKLFLIVLPYQVKVTHLSEISISPPRIGVGLKNWVSLKRFLREIRLL